MRWEKLQPNSVLEETPDEKNSPGPEDENWGPGTRWGHSCNAVKGGKLLYVFGGYGMDNCQTNDVHVFDTVTRTWSKPIMKGIPPSPRDSHSCTTVGDNLFIFGGTDGKIPLSDLHILDTSSNTWISPSVRGEAPEAREGHSAVLIGKRLYIFGGCGKSWHNAIEVYYNDLYILNIETLVWKAAVTSGIPPSARDSHTCSSWKNKIIVIGGEDASDYYLSDVHILDTDTLVWRELSTSGQILPPRAGHSTVALGKSLFVFGGFTDDRNLYDDLYILYVDTGRWIKVTPTGEGPSARFSVAGDFLDKLNGIIVFIGGCNKNLEALDDMYYLHTGISMENGQDEQKQEKLSLRKELKRKCQEQHLPQSHPVNDKGILKIGTKVSLCTLPLPNYGQAGNQKFPLDSIKHPQTKIFEAKVTEGFHYGFTIETNIDGKLLRGILFSNRPTFPHSANDYLSRKKMVVEVDYDKSSNGYQSKLKSATPVQQEKAVHGQMDGVCAKESTSQTPHMETVLASHLNNSADVDASQPHAVPENTQPSLASLPVLKDDSKDCKLNLSTDIPNGNPSSTAPEIGTSLLNQDDGAPVSKEHDPLSSDRQPKCEPA